MDYSKSFFVSESFNVDDLFIIEPADVALDVDPQPLDLSVDIDVDADSFDFSGLSDITIDVPIYEPQPSTWTSANTFGVSSVSGQLSAGVSNDGVGFSSSEVSVTGNAVANVDITVIADTFIDDIF